MVYIYVTLASRSHGRMIINLLQILYLYRMSPSLDNCSKVDNDHDGHLIGNVQGRKYTYAMGLKH